MRNSNSFNTKERIRAILSNLRTQLNPGQFALQLDSACDSYKSEYNEPTNYREFTYEISHFVQIIYKTGLNPSINLTYKDAKSLAIRLLDQCFGTDNSSGFYSAYLETKNKNTRSLCDIHYRLFQTIKDTELSRFKAYVINSLIDPSDWSLQRDVSEYVLEFLDNNYQSSVCKYSGDCFAICYKDLIDLLLSSDEMLLKICNGAFLRTWTETDDDVSPLFS
jgi:hypothetical protein